MKKCEKTRDYPDVSIILPCLNEESSLGPSIDRIRDITEAHLINSEIIVVDNGSTDSSQRIAEEKGVKVALETEIGYGSAYLKGFESAKGKYVFLADPDGSYDFEEIPNFIKRLRGGSDFVIGNRFRGHIEKGAMHWMRRYLGNPILSGILRLFFNTRIGDSQCGMRAIKRDALDSLNLRATGMEFASEMVVKALKNGLKIEELPINYYRRRGKSKLKSVSDGWRHLRFMLLYSPLFLFFIPGLIFLTAGALSMILLYFDLITIYGIKLQYHPMFVSALLVIIGYQLIIFSLFAKTYSIVHLRDTPTLNSLYKYITIEKASIAGILIGIIGVVIYLKIFYSWVVVGFGELNEIKNAILALTLTAIGIQTIFSSFMLSILGIKEK